MASVDLIREAAPDTYTANSTTHTLANPAWQSAVYAKYVFKFPNNLNPFS